MQDGKLVGMDLRVIADAGAYGTHGLTVQMVTGFRGLSTYWLPNARFDCHVAYTNKPVPGAFRGYGAPQALFGLEAAHGGDGAGTGHGSGRVQAAQLDQGGRRDLPMAVAMGEGREGFPQTVAQQRVGPSASRRAQRPSAGSGATIRPGNRTRTARTSGAASGLAVCMHGTGIAGLDMGAAAIKLNDDG